MRTKTLLLTAALSAAGIATSMAQVYSVNAVGYVNTTLVPGYNLVSNPLIAENNTINSLFAGLPPGTQVYKFVNGAFVTATFDDLSGAYEPASAGNQTVMPGEGVFVRNPSQANLTVTFVGEVPQGELETTVPAGFSIVSSQVPQAGTASALGYTGQPGDQIYQWNETTQAYRTSTFDDLVGDWDPALQPLDVGEAIFVRRNAAGVWERTFDINE